MKKQYMKRQITEAETRFDRQPPTALELINAVFNDEEYSPKLALQARAWIEVEAPNGKYYQDNSIRSTDVKKGQIVPWLFPVVDVEQRGRSKIVFVCDKPSMHHKALTFMELKSRFLDAKVNKDDVVTVECNGLSVGDIVAVNVRSGRIPGEGYLYGGGQHVIVIKCVGSQEFTQFRDEGWLGTVNVRESCKYTKKQIQEAIAYWKKQLVKGNYRKVNEAVEVPAGTYRIVMTVDGKAVNPAGVLANIDLGNDNRTVYTFVRASGISDDFFEDDDELYSRELYVFGGGVDIDGADGESIPSTTEPSYFYENVDDFDAGANAKTCIPVINYDKKTVTFNFR